MRSSDGRSREDHARLHSILSEIHAAGFGNPSGSVTAEMLLHDSVFGSPSVEESDDNSAGSGGTEVRRSSGGDVQPSPPPLLIAMPGSPAEGNECAKQQVQQQRQLEQRVRQLQAYLQRTVAECQRSREENGQLRAELAERDRRYAQLRSACRELKRFAEEQRSVAALVETSLATCTASVGALTQALASGTLHERERPVEAAERGLTAVTSVLAYTPTTTSAPASVAGDCAVAAATRRRLNAALRGLADSLAGLEAEVISQFRRSLLMVEGEASTANSSCFSATQGGPRRRSEGRRQPQDCITRLRAVQQQLLSDDGMGTSSTNTQVGMLACVAELEAALRNSRPQTESVPPRGH